MSEEQMVESAETALRELGVHEPVLAAGQFLPRGHTGSMFLGGFVGDGVTSAVGGVVDAAATVGGSIAGARFHDAQSGLPAKMLVAVTDAHVCGFAAATRHSEAGALVFRVRRTDLSVEVHRRLNVRILELIDGSSGARIELEGNRLPVTHSKDVIEVLAH